MRNIFKEIIQDPPKIMYGLERLGLTNYVSDQTYIKAAYFLGFGRKCNLDDPKTYTEKLNWCKLYWRSPLAVKCADKLAAREYVREKGCGQYLNDLLGVWDRVEDIDIATLPDQFVLKGTAGSGDVYICRDKAQYSPVNARKVLMKYENRPLHHKTKEWVYQNIPRRYIAERYIKNKSGSINDYKFFCFHGEPKFLFVGTDRAVDVKFDFYDTQWSWIDVRNGHDHNPDGVAKPQHFDEMMDVARKLSQDFSHVRVDLYEEEGRVFFGELTFFHFGGFMKFEPDEFDYKVGEYWDLSRIPENEIIK